MLTYKLEERGKHLVLIERHYPSSKMCSMCGYVNNQLRLDVRKWVCPKCNIDYDRDINASINIRSKGIENLKKNSIKIIKNNDRNVGTTGLAFGENVRLINQQFLRKEEATCL
ncbi:MAG: zinc ribbon domain-containing protein [Candidatus Thorarchaeota archaeon]